VDAAGPPIVQRAWYYPESGAGGIHQDYGPGLHDAVIGANGDLDNLLSHDFVITNSVLYGNRSGGSLVEYNETVVLDNLVQWTAAYFNAWRPHHFGGVWAQLRVIAGNWRHNNSAAPFVSGGNPWTINNHYFDIYDAGAANLTLRNCLVEWETGSGWGAGLGMDNAAKSGVDPALTMTDMTPGLINDGFPPLAFSNTLTPGTGPVPLPEGLIFVNAVEGDLRPASGSALIDGGLTVVDTDLSTPAFDPLPATDLAGQPRIVSTGGGQAFVDIGAYEYQGDG
jgi:hypothetical protein